MVTLSRSHKLRLHPSLLALVRALALLDGVLRGLDPARDLVADLRGVALLVRAARPRWWRGALGSFASLARMWPTLRALGRRR